MKQGLFFWIFILASVSADKYFTFTAIINGRSQDCYYLDKVKPKDKIELYAASYEEEEDKTVMHLTLTDPTGQVLLDHLNPDVDSHEIVAFNSGDHKICILNRKDQNLQVYLAITHTSEDSDDDFKDYEFAEEMKDYDTKHEDVYKMSVEAIRNSLEKIHSKIQNSITHLEFKAVTYKIDAYIMEQKDTRVNGRSLFLSTLIIIVCIAQVHVLKRFFK